MQIDRHTRRSLRLQNAIFTALLLALMTLLGWLAETFSHSGDWTATGRHTLGGESREVIELLDEPVAVTAYVGPDPVTRRGIEDLVNRYRRAGLEVELEFVNPDTDPGLARDLGLRSGGEIILRRGDAEQRLQRLDEAEFTNALARLARTEERWVVFVEGHGERDPLGDANHDLGELGQALEQRGLNIQTINLARTPRIPDNADLLVIAGPRSDYLPGELASLERYLDAGGNLLWLAEPEGRERLRGLAELLGIERLPGVAVDANAEAYGADTPDFAVITDYGEHAVTDGFDAITLFPQAMALEATGERGWRARPLLRTGDRSWTETGPIEGRIGFDADAGETAGPLVLGLAATRGTQADHASPAGQRIAVLGDGDFLSNAYIGNGGNLDLGARLVNWLVADDERIEITPRRPADIELDMSTWALGIIGIGFLFVLPFTLLATGILITWRRHRR